MARRNTALDAGLEARIRTIRTHRVMLDRDLAELYGVSTGAVNQAVSRNLDRFPAEFMFRLAAEEFRVAMLSTVLRSPRAVAREEELAELEPVRPLNLNFIKSLDTIRFGKRGATWAVDNSARSLRRSAGSRQT